MAISLNQLVGQLQGLISSINKKQCSAKRNLGKLTNAVNNKDTQTALKLIEDLWTDIEDMSTDIHARN